MDYLAYKEAMKARVRELWKEGEPVGMIRATYGIDDELVRKLTEGVVRNVKSRSRNKSGKFNDIEYN